MSTPPSCRLLLLNSVKGGEDECSSAVTPPLGCDRLTSLSWTRQNAILPWARFWIMGSGDDKAPQILAIAVVDFVDKNAMPNHEAGGAFYPG